jgi:hypothetical protein
MVFKLIFFSATYKTFFPFEIFATKMTEASERGLSFTLPHNYG